MPKYNSIISQIVASICRDCEEKQPAWSKLYSMGWDGYGEILLCPKCYRLQLPQDEGYQYLLSEAEIIQYLIIKAGGMATKSKVEDAPMDYVMRLVEAMPDSILWRKQKK